MDEFNRILQLATRTVQREYFHFPVAREGGRGSIYRERVYCYELYHQLRRRWPRGCPFVLNGEVDKRGHPLPAMRGINQSPDFLVHQPGDMAGNHLIMEVKSAAGGGKGIRKDLKTLRAFRQKAGYARTILLIYGEDGGAVAVARGLFGRADRGTEVWHHAQVGRAAVRVW